MKIAVCYFGLLRTFKKTVDSHRVLFHALQKMGVETDIYMHTWYGSLVNRRGNDKGIYENDIHHLEYANAYKYKLENQDEFIQTLEFQDYFKQDIFLQYGESRSTEWFPDLILFHLCSIESQRRVIESVEKENKSYDKIIMMRPDILFKDTFPMSIFFDLTPKKVFVASHDSGEGYNDQFAVFNYNDIEPYKNRIFAAKDYRRDIGRIVGEKYLKHTLDTNGLIVEEVSIPFFILRD